MEKHYVDALRNNNNLLIKELYYSNRNAFLSFARTYKLTKADAIDIYQESFIILRKHALSGKLYEVKSSLKTYLFGISKHLIYKKWKEYTPKHNYEAQLYNNDEKYEEIMLEEELTQEQLLLKHYFKKIGKSCQEMLTLSFYRGLTNEEIASSIGYENEAVVRSHKSRCLKTLKDLIKNSKND